MSARCAATITVKGLDVFNSQVYVYGRADEAYKLVNGHATIPARGGSILPSSQDGLGTICWWTTTIGSSGRLDGPNVGIKPNTGKRSALTAQGWLAPEYR
jgi:hypothetical protein